MTLLWNTKFDAIFLCRSDTWLPPHLDIYFDAFIKVFAKKFSCVLCQESVVNPRNIHNIIKEYDKMLDSVYYNITNENDF